MGTGPVKGIVTGYSLFKDDDNLAIERNKPGEKALYDRLEDHNNDGKVTLEEYLTMLEKYYSQNYSITESQKSLAKYLSQTPPPAVRKLIDLFGCEKFADLAEEAGTDTWQLMDNLSALQYLIRSEEDLDQVAERALGFIRDLKGKCGWLSGRYADLSIIRGTINTIDEITARGKEFIEIISGFCKGFDPLNDPCSDLQAMSGLFNKYGLAPFAHIARQTEGRQILIFRDPKLQKLLEAQGIFVFMDIAKEAGKATGDLLYALTQEPNTEFVERFGFEHYRFLITWARKNSVSDLRSLFTCGLQSVKHLIQDELSFRLAGAEVINCLKSLEPGNNYAFFQALSDLKPLINSLADLKAVSRRLLEINQELGGKIYLLRDIVKTGQIKTKSDLMQDLYTLLRANSKSRTDKYVVQMLAELDAKKGNYLRAFSIIKTYQRHPQPDLKYFTALKFKIGTALLSQGSKVWSSAEGNLFISNSMLARDIFEDIFENDPESSLAQRGLILKEALEYLSDQNKPLALVTAQRSKPFTIKKLKGVSGLSLVYAGDKETPEVIPGKVKAAQSGKFLRIDNYEGRFRVVFNKAEATFPNNNDALLKALRILPKDFFQDIKSIVFTGLDRETAGYYFPDEVRVHESTDPLGTIVHELAHHWDLGLSFGTDHRNESFGDLSQLYYDISWSEVDHKRHISGWDYDAKTIDKIRQDFDKDDFARNYGLCNPKEDIATLTESYVTDGLGLRKKIRRQMEEGNFELAVKYLFVKHLMPFRGREYGIENDGLEIDEVKAKVYQWQSIYHQAVHIENRPKEKYREIPRRTISILERIEDKIAENHYR